MIPKVWNQNRKWIWQSSDGPKSSDNGSTKQKTKCSPKRWSGITEVTATDCYVRMDVSRASNSEVKKVNGQKIHLLGHLTGCSNHTVRRFLLWCFWKHRCGLTPDVLRLEVKYFRNICRGQRPLWPGVGRHDWQLFRLLFCTAEGRVYERLTHNAFWPLFTLWLNIVPDWAAWRGETGAEETNPTHGEGKRWGFFHHVPLHYICPTFMVLGANVFLITKSLHVSLTLLFAISLIKVCWCLIPVCTSISRVHFEMIKCCSDD